MHKWVRLQGEASDLVRVLKRDLGKARLDWKLGQALTAVGVLLIMISSILGDADLKVFPAVTLSAGYVIAAMLFLPGFIKLLRSADPLKLRQLVDLSSAIQTAMGEKARVRLNTEVRKTAMYKNQGPTELYPYPSDRQTGMTARQKWLELSIPGDGATIEMAVERTFWRMMPRVLESQRVQWQVDSMAVAVISDGGASGAQIMQRIQAGLAESPPADLKTSTVTAERIELLFVERPWSPDEAMEVLADTSVRPGSLAKWLEWTLTISKLDVSLP